MQSLRRPANAAAIPKIDFVGDGAKATWGQDLTSTDRDRKSQPRLSCSISMTLKHPKETDATWAHSPEDRRHGLALVGDGEGPARR
jgi:hypothetical protein